MAELVSVIIPTYNGAKYIRQTVDAVLRQTYTNVEVLVVDDGSTDNTRELMHGWPPSVQYFIKENGGPASARNFGIKKARGRYLAFCDGDDVWEPRKLEQQIACFERDGDLGLVYSEVTMIDENDQPQPYPPRQRPAGKIFLQLFGKNSIPTSSVVIKRECLQRVGGFDEDPELISVEDYDLWLRVAGEYRIGFVDAPLVKYRRHIRGISKNLARSYLGEAKVIQKTLASFAGRFPSLPGLMPARLGRLFFEYGIDLFYLRQIAEARRQFWQSVRYDPLNFKSWFYFGLCLLGEAPLNWLRGLEGRSNR